MPRLKVVKTDPESIRQLAAKGMEALLQSLEGASPEHPASEAMLKTFVELAKYLEMDRAAKAVKEFSERFDELQKIVHSLQSGRSMEKLAPKAFPRPNRVRGGSRAK